MSSGLPDFGVKNDQNLLVEPARKMKKKMLSFHLKPSLFSRTQQVILKQVLLLF